MPSPAFDKTWRGEGRSIQRRIEDKRAKEASRKVQELATALDSPLDFIPPSCEKPQVLKTEYVYFVQAEDGGPIKIGRSTQPEFRLKQMQTGNPKRLKLLQAIPREGCEARDLEEELHECFEKYRLRGEWFEPVPEILEYIVGHGFT